MARSKYVYVVASGTGMFSLQGLFTVKHEARTFMEKMIKEDAYNYHSNLRMLRTPDGTSYQPELALTRKDLENGTN